MDLVLAVAGAALAAAFVVAVPFVLYPLVLMALAPFRRPSPPVPPATLPTVSLVVVVRNAAALVEDKIRNSLQLDYPRDRLELVFFSDGSTDATESILRSHAGATVRVLASARHEGKIHGLNAAVGAATGEVVAFSDGDALLDRDALLRLAEHYGDPAVGGVSGRTTIGADRTGLEGAQSVYLRLNGLLKRLETRGGSVTAGEGKIYSVRRELFRPIPDGVSDDFYGALSVIDQGRRFAYEPRAVARIRVPSRSPGHEVARRRRIVSQSLRALRLVPGVLNPFRQGAFAIGLLVNKVLRRLLPFALILALPSSLVLASAHRWAAWLFAAQAAFYALAAAHSVVARAPALLRRPAEIAFYVVVGQYGTLLGVLDFAFGRSVSKWDPIKGDARVA